VTLLVPERRFDPDQPEMMDIANHSPHTLREDLENLRAINRRFGGLSAVRTHISGLLSRTSGRPTIEILDLATGSADHPIALVELARMINRNVRITAIERNPHTLAIARERVETYSEISVLGADILSLDFPEKSFDIVLCSLAIHHFSRKDGLQILRMMNKLSRIGLIVNDLNRSWPAAWSAWTYAHCTTRNPMTLHDSYVSVLRAYTPKELLDMAIEAEIPNPRLHKHPFFRLLLVGQN
jgi:2-polyprenyl-3-methyl-5-hydroxy-6-metoxy-1,4-benzoquinol methylase